MNGNSFFLTFEVYSLERSPKFAKNIEVLVGFAGLNDLVEVVVGPNDGLRKLYEDGKLERIDMMFLMFLDNYKPVYTTDLRLCKQLGLIKTSTVLAALSGIRSKHRQGKEDEIDARGQGRHG